MTNYWWWVSCLHRQALLKTITTTMKRMKKTSRQTRNQATLSSHLSTGCMPASLTADCRKSSARCRTTNRWVILSKHCHTSTKTKQSTNDWLSICCSNCCLCWILKTFSDSTPTSMHGFGTNWNMEKRRSFTRYITTSSWISGLKCLKSPWVMICLSATSRCAINFTNSPTTWNTHPNWKKQTLTFMPQTSPVHGCSESSRQKKYTAKWWAASARPPRSRQSPRY